MIRQIFDKLPRKHSKSHHKDQNINGGLPANSHTKTVSVRNNSNSKSNLFPLKHLNLAVIGVQRASGVLHRHKSSSISKKSMGAAAVVTVSVPPSPVGVKNECLELVSGGNYDPLPGFGDVSSDERDDLFRRKLSMCCVVFDFGDLLKNQREKEVKRKTLMELVDFVSTAGSKFSEVMIQDSTHMVGVNLFRPLHLLNREVKVMDMYDVEEEEFTMEPAWPHLQLVYEFFHRFVASSENDTKISKRYVDQHFISRLLDLFDSEDQRERECLKTTLHRIYGKFMVHRPFIRKSINNIFFQFIYENEKHNGIAELLEILGSIINGFALPLKEEHKLFLVRALIPLHKSKGMPLYHQQLSYSITQFVEKDFKLADTVIRGLLKYWPITNSSKEVMFLSELEEVLEATQITEFQRCMVPLARQLARCVSSSHFQVAEKALFLWNNEHIRGLLTQERKAVLPIIFPALEENSKGHWNQAVRSLTLNVEKIFHDADPALFADCLAKLQEAESGRKEAEVGREITWKRVEDMAAAMSGSAASGSMPVRGFLSSLVSTATAGRRVASGR